MTIEIQQQRVQHLNDNDILPGDLVVYWMQASVRAAYNHALEYAIRQANLLRQPLLVVFGFTDDYPEANLRSFAFLLEGLQDVQRLLAERGIEMIVRRGSPDEVAIKAARHASLLVTDRGYLRHQRDWRHDVAGAVACRLTQVESDVVVPVELASPKLEHAARTLRPRITRHLEEFLVELGPTSLKHQSLHLGDDPANIDLSDIDTVLASMQLDRSVSRLSHLYQGGESQAHRALTNFLDTRFVNYARNRNQPQTNDVSDLSKYLHYGHISPVEIALRIQDSGAANDNIDTFLEELIIRRELPINFVFYQPDYDRFSHLSGWARRTLEDHQNDPRAYLYTAQQLEHAETHDDYWNAAMREMVHTGYMHNYMRMYWGKKVLEWSATPAEAYRVLLKLNNKYFLDGRDPNSYGNIAWIFGQHDRAWQERAIFGKVRYMSAAGLERKSRPAEYVEKVEQKIRQPKITYSP